MASGAIAAHAPAKINLALHVVGRRVDGFHLLETLIVFTRFGDTLTVSEAERDEVAVEGDYAALVPADGSNLVARARDALRALSPADAVPVRIALDKRIPVMGGVGGGSSNAAAALKALDGLWNLQTDPGRLADIAISLGADVPMCLESRPLVARGIGEIIEPVHGLPPLHLVLVNPGTTVSTPRIFAGLTRRDNPPLPALPAWRDARALARWLSQTRNDMAATAEALEPSIGDAIAVLSGTQPLLARMSGSGATCFGLYPDEASAERAAADIASRRPGWFVTATQTTL
jgi:4-diphosphocytidyl-2-C-methyl-D-erythritol kinase